MLQEESLKSTVPQGGRGRTVPVRQVGVRDVQRQDASSVLGKSVPALRVFPQVGIDNLRQVSAIS